MIHLAGIGDKGRTLGPLCGAARPEGDAVYAIAALESDCDACRARVFVGPATQRGCGVQRIKIWTPEPYPGADTMLAEAIACRNASSDDE